MRVFISHAPKDVEVARKLAADLRRQGLAVWLGEDIIRPGAPWAEKLSHAVELSDAVIVVMTRNSGAGQWQTSEIAFAISSQERNASKLIIPVLIDKGAEVPFFLKTLVYCDLSDENAYARNLPQLIQAIQRPEPQSLRGEEVDRLRIDSLKAERHLLAQEMESYVRKKKLWMASVIGSLASVIAASATLYAGFLGSIEWGNRTIVFIIGALAGVLSSFAASYVLRLLYRRAARLGGKHAK